MLGPEFGVPRNTWLRYILQVVRIEDPATGEVAALPPLEPAAPDVKPLARWSK